MSHYSFRDDRVVNIQVATNCNVLYPDPTWTTYLLDPDAAGDLPEADADLFGGAA